MPYIKQESRERLEKLVSDLGDEIIKIAACQTKRVWKEQVKGIHNYVMFRIALKLVEYAGISYSTLQDIVGTFECCKAEFLRRVVAPYEDGAIERNGDVEGL